MSTDHLDEQQARLRIVRVPIGELTLDPANARTHDRRNLAEIRASLARFGQRLPIVVRAGRVVGGNATTTAARELGWTHLDTVAADDLSEGEARALAVALNRTGELAGWDTELLVELLLATPELEGTGFTPAELAELQAALGQLPGGDGGRRLSDVDEVPEPPPAPPPAPGDLWQLGRHRLLCGDATDRETVKRLLDGGRADMAATDPPYAIYGSSSGVSVAVADDRMVRPFFAAMWRALYGGLALFGHAYVHCDWRSWAAMWETARAANMTIANMLVWDKGGFGLGSNYANNHELLVFACRLPRQRTMTASNPAGARQVHRPNVLHYDRPRGETDRPVNAAKPVELVRELVRNSTDPGGSVLDLYAGSGTVAIAAELEDRRAFLLEVDPGRLRRRLPPLPTGHRPAARARRYGPTARLRMT
jgi:DNA modification methylase